MKRFVFALAALAFAAGCCGGKSDADGLDLMKEENFKAVVDGKPVSLYTLTNGDLTMQVTNFGARVVSLWTPDRDGKMADIVLGYDKLDRYVNNTGERFLGAVVGRVANRIDSGRFTLDGKEYNAPQNSNGQTLHGGNRGVDMVVWDVVDVKPNAIVLHYLAADGEDGFPGNLDITMTYTLTPDNEFQVLYLAKTDAPTVVNMSHHSFFNLKGEGGGTIADNVLTIKADAITPTDERLIPTGEIRPVEGTPFDFREPHVIGERIDADDEQLKNGRGYDMNWVLARENPVHVVTAAVLELLVVGIDTLADHVRLAEIERRALDGAYLARGNQTLVGGGDGIGLDGQHIVGDGAAALALEVEERVVRHVNDGRSVSLGQIEHLKLVVGGEGVGHGNVEVARETVLAVGRQIVQHDRVGFDVHHIPHDHIHTAVAAVQGLAVAVLRSVVLLAVERETAAVDAVGHAAHHGAEKTLARIVDIAVEFVVTQHYVGHLTVAVGGPQRHHARAEIGHLHGQVAVGKRVKRHGLAVDHGLEILLLHQIEPVGIRLSAAASRCESQCGEGKNKSFHISLRY